MQKKKLAVRLAAPVAIAVAAIAIPSLSGTAQAGTICRVVHDGASRYAVDRTDSRIIGTMQEGQQVAAAGPFDMWQVARADNGEPLGFMRQSDLNCSHR
ncbi:hypothetical protein [Streptomyces albidus (ex Kaewkla and Franco 2022)]|uniref:hypothetical protein n=1 Tax=Streptomyces albidus (ex Kaewkla and Franco 2022) TaxID=722709 RepID=UPI0015EFB23B|nr:hypothetical protein [Streptomyces albidus (ex Kaewkla and Franco 2022)]